jgi:hypothetical protein
VLEGDKWPSALQDQSQVSPEETENNLRVLVRVK